MDTRGFLDITSLQATTTGGRMDIGFGPRALVRCGLGRGTAAGITIAATGANFVSQFVSLGR